MSDDTKVQHTPGPWMIETSNSWRRIGTGSGGGQVCCPLTQPDGHPDLHFPNGGWDGPDARLIAAAPDLLAACKEAATQFHFYAEQHAAKRTDDGRKKAAVNLRMARKMEAAIAKAEGR